MRPENHSGSFTYIIKDGVKVTAFPPKSFPKMYRVVTYCRVSTAHEAQLESLEAQIEYYRDYVNRQLGWILVGEYADVKSARNLHARKEFSLLLQQCMSGNIDIIVTKTVSRFGRNTVETLAVLRKLKEKT